MLKLIVIDDLVYTSHDYDVVELSCFSTQRLILIEFEDTFIRDVSELSFYEINFHNLSSYLIVIKSQFENFYFSLYVCYRDIDAHIDDVHDSDDDALRELLIDDVADFL